MRHLLSVLIICLLSAPALAQDEPLIGGEGQQPPPTAQPQPQPQPQPPPPPPPPPQPQPQPQAQPQPTAPAQPATGKMTPRKLKDVTDTDHDMVIKDVGLQVTYLAELASGNLYGPDKPKLAASFSLLGVRAWLTRRVGLDLGLGVAIVKPPDLPTGESADTAAGFGLIAGVPFALGVYRHVTMIAGPDIGFALYHLASGVNPWMFMLRGKAGIELHLGFIDIPRVSLLGTFSLGLRVFNDSNSTEIVFGPDNGFSIRGLFESSIGLVFYL